jgi:predicted kinase
LQLEAGSAPRAAAVDDCSRYLAWARARVARRRPALMVTCGLSGSGKTWLARHLASCLGALHVRSDVERKRLAGLEAHADSRSRPDAGIYSLEFNERTYAHLHDCAAAALVAGESIVVDAAFLRHGERQQFLELARQNDAPFAIVHCSAPDPVLRQRVAARAAARNDASEAGLDVLQRQPGYWEPFDVQQQAAVVAADTSDPSAIERALEQLMHRIPAG